jgi:hypothetical protein
VPVAEGPGHRPPAARIIGPAPGQGAGGVRGSAGVRAAREVLRRGVRHRVHRVIQPLIGPQRGHGDHPVAGLAVPAQPLMAHVRGLHPVLAVPAVFDHQHPAAVRRGLGGKATASSALVGLSTDRGDRGDRFSVSTRAKEQGSSQPGVRRVPFRCRARRGCRPRGRRVDTGPCPCSRRSRSVRRRAPR